MLINIILIVLTILPVFFLLRYTFKKDKIEKEPAKLLSELFIAGIISTIIALILSTILKKAINLNNAFFNSFVEVGFIEEMCKWIGIILITWKSKEFNYKFDAIVYSIFVALGFAFVENMGYAFRFGITATLLRGVISVPSHAFFAVYMGYYLGISKSHFKDNDKKTGNLYIIYSILIPTTLHGIYDYCLVSGNDGLFALFFIFIISLYILSFKTINTASINDAALDGYEFY